MTSTIAPKAPVLAGAGRPADVTRPGHARLALALSLALPALILATTAVARFVNGHTGADLPQLDQGLWLVSRGHAPDTTVFGVGLLQDHFGPAILLFAPLYRLISTPVWLLVGQAGAAWLAVWQISRRLLPSLGTKRAALVGGALLLSPPVGYALLWDAHAVVFAAPLAVAAVFAILEDRPWTALAFGLGAALFRADVAYGVLAAFLFLPGVSLRRRLRPGLLLAAYLLLATYLEMSLGGSGKSPWSAYYTNLGASPADALTHPWRIAAALATPATLGKVLPWLAAVGFLCLARPRLMLAGLAAGLPTLLSSWPGTKYWGFHYGMAPTLLFAVALVPVLRERPEWSRFALAGVAVLSLLGGPFMLNPPVETSADRASTFFSADGGARCIVAGIPAHAGVSTSLGPSGFLAHRPALYYWPYPFAGIPQQSGLATPRPDLEAGIDYVIRPVGSQRPVPEGFVADVTAGTYARFRRAATTVPRVPTCATASALSGR